MCSRVSETRARRGSRTEGRQRGRRWRDRSLSNLSSVFSLPSVPRLTSLDWRVDYLLSSSYLQQADTNNIRFRLHVQPPNATAAAAQTPAAAEGETDQPQPEEEEAQRAVRAALTGIPPELLSFSLTPTDFKLLYADLKQAKQLFANV